MLTLSPIIILIFTSVLLQVLGRVKLAAGRTWLISAIASMVTWILMIGLRLLMPASWGIDNWTSGTFVNERIFFQFTKETWVFAFLLVSILVAVIFYEARFLESSNYINLLTGSMLLTAFGLLSIFSGSGLTFILTWVLIDCVEFGILVGIIKNSEKHQTAIASLLLRITGLLLLIYILATQSPEQNNEGFTVLGTSSILFILVAILRMGILPVHVPYTEEPRIRRGLGSLLRFIPVLSVMSFQTIIGIKEFTNSQYFILMFLFTLGSIFGAVSWYFARDELKGRPYWIFAFGNLALIGFLRGAPDSLLGVAVLMVAGGAGIFLNSPRLQKNKLYLPFLMLGMLALPYSPSATLAEAVWGKNIEISNFLLILCLAFLLGGVIRHSLRRNEGELQGEDWMRLFHSIAMILIAISPWVASIFYWQKIQGLQYWWFPISLLAFWGVIFFGDRLRRRQGSIVTGLYIRFRKSLDPAVLYADRFFQFHWIILWLNAIGRFLANVINLLVRVLEGDGGILWSFLFLVLLASLIITGQNP